MVKYLSCRMTGITLFCFMALLLVACNNELVVPPLVAVPSSSATPGVHVLTLWHALSDVEAGHPLKAGH